MKFATLIGRILSITLVYGVYTETGIWTALAVLLLYVGAEMRNSAISRLIDITKPH